jgi:hypothetical protein
MQMLLVVVILLVILLAGWLERKFKNDDIVRLLEVRSADESAWSTEMTRMMRNLEEDEVRRLILLVISARANNQEMGQRHTDAVVSWLGGRAGKRKRAISAKRPVDSGPRNS